MGFFSVLVRQVAAESSGGWRCSRRFLDEPDQGGRRAEGAAQIERDEG